MFGKAFKITAGVLLAPVAVGAVGYLVIGLVTLAYLAVQ